MKKLYSLIGQIIENSQYIEWNLAIMLRCHMILKEFEKSNTISLVHFEKAIQNAEDLALEMQKMTLGEIIYKVKETNKLSYDEINELEKVLRTRNYLVHQYFKKHNFLEEGKNLDIVCQEEKWLHSILQNMHHVNVTLAKIIEYQEKEITSIA